MLSGNRRNAAGAEVQDRITWPPNDAGSVQQDWETSSDGGTTWQAAFNGTYRKKE